MHRFAWIIVVAVTLGVVAGHACAQDVLSQWTTASGAWNVASNRIPGVAPDNGAATYAVQIGDLAPANAQVTFAPVSGLSATVTSLSLTDGADLSTGGYRLNILTQTTVDGAGTTLRIDAPTALGAPAFQTLMLDVQSGGALQLNGGTLAAEQLRVDAASALRGFGALQAGNVDAIVEQAFVNEGLIEVAGAAGSPATLTLQAIGVDVIDFDGAAEAGIVDIANAVADAGLDTLTLVVDGPLSDAFGGGGAAELHIGQRDTVTFQRNFQIDAGAIIAMDGGSHVATLNGSGDATSIVDADFSIAGKATIANDLAFVGTANTMRRYSEAQPCGF